MEETVNTLVDLNTVEVSLVDKGANKRVFAIMKAETMNDVVKDILEVPLEQESEVIDSLVEKDLSEDARHSLIGAMRLVQAYKDEAGMREALVSLAELLDFNKPEMEEPSMDQEIVQEETSQDDLNLASVPEEVRAQVEDLWKANEEAVKKAEELEAVLKAERDERLTKEYIAKAEAEFGNIPGHGADELGPMLKSLNAHDAEMAGKIEGLLKTMSQVLAKSEVFAEAGVTTQDAGSGKNPESQLDQLATQYSTETPGVSYAKAYDSVLKSEEGRRLYAEYVQGK